MNQLLFVTRKFPPSVGGIQTASFELHRALTDLQPVTLLSWGGSQKLLPLIYLRFALRIAQTLRRSDSPTLLLGDGVLAPLAVLAKWWQPTVRVACILHGLDITYPSPLYQQALRRSIPSIDLFIVPSTGTKRTAVAKGVPTNRCRVIPWGVSRSRTSKLTRAEARTKLLRRLGLSHPNPFILLHVGRLVRRKGLVWFTEAVLPSLLERAPSLVMATIGAGPDQPHLTPLLAALPADRLRHLTWVTDQELPDLYRGANLFVMPNIEVPGDIEGFGLVALEAAANGTFTVGSDVSGVNEAVVEGTTGMLLPPGDAKRYVEVIADFTQVPEKAEELGRLAEDFAHRECSWARTALAYQDSLFPPVDRSVEPFPAPGRGARPS